MINNLFLFAVFNEIFECRRCGRCCQRPHPIGLSKKDILRLADGLEETHQAIVKKYVIMRDGYQPCIKYDRPCIFLDENNLCKVYPYRPASCRVFPFQVMFGESEFVIWDECPVADKIEEQYNNFINFWDKHSANLTEIHRHFEEYCKKNGLDEKIAMFACYASQHMRNRGQTTENGRQRTLLR